jgi:hypothetical protein
MESAEILGYAQVQERHRRVDVAPVKSANATEYCSTTTAAPRKASCCFGEEGEDSRALVVQLSVAHFT